MYVRKTNFSRPTKEALTAGDSDYDHDNGKQRTHALFA